MTDHPQGQEPTDCVDHTMWAVNIQGPDDIAAAEDKGVAEAVALLLNRQFVRHKFTDVMRAVVIPWPHGYEAWKAEADNQFRPLKDMLSEVGFS